MFPLSLASELCWLTRREELSGLPCPTVESPLEEGQPLLTGEEFAYQPDLLLIRCCSLALREQVSAGLLMLRQSGMHHHDLHPGNILVDSTGAIKIIDLESWVPAQECNAPCPDLEWLLPTTSLRRHRPSGRQSAVVTAAALLVALACWLSPWLKHE
jgi:hypothetical protein